VIGVARRFRGYGLPLGDLIQEGNVGLMQAARRFDPGRDVRFATYACWWIRAAIQDDVLRNWSVVRTGTTRAQKSLFFGLRSLRARIEMKGHAASGRSAAQDDGAPGWQETVAAKLAVPLAEVAAMHQRLTAPDMSLSTPVDVTGGGTSLQDRIADERDDPELVTLKARDGRRRRQWLAAALNELSPRERLIIIARWLNGVGDTLDTLGRRLGVSKERVRQLESRALDKLRRVIGARIEQTADLFASA